MKRIRSRRPNSGFGALQLVFFLERGNVVRFDRPGGSGLVDHREPGLRQPQPACVRLSCSLKVRWVRSESMWRSVEQF